MLERLALVTIDAGSNILGTDITINDEMVGTSSGKGILATGISNAGGLAYDSGRAYRTITLAAAMEGVSPDDEEAVREKLNSWRSAGRFGHCATGMTLDGIEVDEKLLHGEDVSKRVALFSPLDSVRELTKELKAEWLLEYVLATDTELVGFDGREMKRLVLSEMPEILKAKGLKADVAKLDLVTSFYMIVDIVEAARRRMAQRGVLEDYNDPHWMLHPKLYGTVEELRDRARRDESRSLDPVRIPEEYYLYRPKDGRLELGTQDTVRLPSLIRENRSVLVDTTGIGIEEVQRSCLAHVAMALQTRGNHTELAEKLAQKVSE